MTEEKKTISKAHTSKDFGYNPNQLADSMKGYNGQMSTTTRNEPLNGGYNGNNMVDTRNNPPKKTPKQ